MSQSVAMPLGRAAAFAERVIEELSPFCKRIEVAGSIRRRCQMVRDIDLVVIAADRAGLRARALQQSTEVCNGDGAFRLMTRAGVQIDIYHAREAETDMFGHAKPGNWGSVMLCRTGSRKHNIYLVGKAKYLGYQWRLADGIVDQAGAIVAAETE